MAKYILLSEIDDRDEFYRDLKNHTFKEFTILWGPRSFDDLVDECITETSEGEQYYNGLAYEDGPVIELDSCVRSGKVTYRIIRENEVEAWVNSKIDDRLTDREHWRIESAFYHQNLGVAHG